MMHTIQLHGFLGKKYAKTVRMDGLTMFQLMRGLISRFGPQFKEDIRVNNWHLINGPKKPGNDLGEEDLNQRLTKKTLHLVPAVVGASATLRVVLGVVLIAVGAYTGQAWLVQTGAALAIGGVVEMLTKPPSANAQSNQTDNASFIYNSATNVGSQGGAIPILYGRVQRASSVIITADFSSDEVIQ